MADLDLKKRLKDARMAYNMHVEMLALKHDISNADAACLAYLAGHKTMADLFDEFVKVPPAPHKAEAEATK